MLVNRQIATNVSPPPSSPKAIQATSPTPAVESVGKPQQTKTPSPGTMRPSGLRTSTGAVNASKDSPILQQSLGQTAPEQLKAQFEGMAPAIQAEFSSLEIQPRGLLAEIQTARQSLKPVSKHQVLNLGDTTTGSTTKESTISRKLGTEVGGVPLDKDRLPGPDGTIDILGHGSKEIDSKTGQEIYKIEGKNPKELALLLKEKYGLKEIKTINLVSCQSENFRAAFEQALSDFGVIISDKVEGATGRVAVDRATGKMLDENVLGNLSQIDGHDGTLGKNFDNLISSNKVYPVGQLDVNGQIQLDPHHKVGEAGIIPFVGSLPLDQNITNTVKAVVASAVDQAFKEFTDRTLIQSLSDQYLALSSDFPSLHNPQIRIQGLFDYVGSSVSPGKGHTEGYGMLPTKLGYLIEERVTQIICQNIKANDPSLQGLNINFQVPIGGSIPDIVISSGSQPPFVHVDITASASTGHILDKDPVAWFSQDIHPYEVTYLSIPNEKIHEIFTTTTPISLDSLKDAAAAQLAAKQQIRSDLLTTLEPFVTLLLKDKATFPPEVNIGPKDNEDMVKSKAIKYYSNQMLNAPALDQFMRTGFVAKGGILNKGAKQIDPQNVFKTLLAIMKFNPESQKFNTQFKDQADVDMYYQSTLNIAKVIYSQWSPDLQQIFNNSWSDLSYPHPS